MEEENIYEKEGAEEKLESDEISPEEEGFIKGYEEGAEEKEEESE